MIVLLRSDADPDATRAELQGLGLWTSVRSGNDGNVRALTVDAPSPPIAASRVERVPGVAQVLVSPSSHPRVDRQVLGAEQDPFLCATAPTLFAGPCSVESPAQIDACAAAAARAGATYLRGGAFKPRTSPYSFDGHGSQALAWIRAAADAHGLRVVTEAMSERHVAAVASVADMIQVGARNMANYALLSEVGKTSAAVLLKRNPGATVDEWLLAGEHLLAHGARSVVFCERGIRSFDSGTRYTLDVGAIARVKHVHGQRVVVDASHAAGRRDLVRPLTLAGLAAGADGAMVEFHTDARQALSDGPQALSPNELRLLALEAGVLDPSQPSSSQTTPYQPGVLR